MRAGLGGVSEVAGVLGWPSGEVAGGHPDGEVTGDLVDAGRGGDVVFPAGGVAADDLIAPSSRTATEVNQTGSSSSGWMTTKVLSTALRSSISMNSASSDGSSMWSPLSLSAR